VKSAIDLTCDKNTTQKRDGELLQKNKVFSEILTDHPINLVMKIILNNDYKCATLSSNTLFQDLSELETTSGWHVDYPYHDISPPWGRPGNAPLSLQSIWALDEFTLENGGTRIIQGSHKFDMYPTHEQIVSLEHEMTTVVCPKGSVIIAHGAWWHSQSKNKTSSPRACLLATFSRKWIASKDNMIEQFERFNENEKTDGLRKIIYG
jgi:ectoine hydroxylase-related dioxygenase (phytanoyl-CoA dioxygenase family)